MPIDPRRKYCRCGYSWTPGLYEKLIMLIRGEYVKTCPRCQSNLHLVLVHHVVVKEREYNLDESIWRKG